MSKVRSYIEKNPAAYAGFRAIDVYSNKGEDSMAELDEVPFLESALFPVLVAAFALLKRLRYLFESVSRTGNYDRSIKKGAHIFVLNSSNKYRSYSFVEVGSQLRDRGQDVVFVCSPDATDKIDEWRQKGFRIETFGELLRFVPISRLPSLFLKSVRLSLGLRTRIPEEFSFAPASLVLNMTFLELLKRECFQPYSDLDPMIHTYSPMPYMLGPADPERIFVYQHGLQWGSNENPMAPSNFIPATYLLWGDPWLENFERLTHPEADLQVVGSPWHDRLARMSEEQPESTEWDVVFLSASKSARSPTRTKSYERLVADVIEICEEHGFSIAIKLHPAEDGKWYEQRNWSQFIHEFNDIDSAILSTEIMITNASSAFIECAVMGTPVIVADLWDFGLERLGPLSGVYFTSDREEIESMVVDIVRSRDSVEKAENANEMILIGGSTDRIVNAVT